MNITSEKFSELERSINFPSAEEKSEFEEFKIQFRFMREVQELLDAKIDKYPGSRFELSQRLGVSKSFVTQLFNGDKKLNLSIINKLQKVFNKQINISFMKKAEATPLVYTKSREEAEGFRKKKLAKYKPSKTG